MLIIDELPQVSLGLLKKEGLLEGWSPQTVKSHGMSVEVGVVDYDPNDCRIYITWNSCGKTFKQFVALVRVETNLGLGYYRWFFYDHERQIKFLKIYYNGYEFVPRIDLEDAFYADQIKTKRERTFEHLFLKPLMVTNKMGQILKQPNLKIYYRGKHTKKIQRLNKLMTKLEKL